MITKTELEYIEHWIRVTPQTIKNYNIKLETAFFDITRQNTYVFGRQRTWEILIECSQRVDLKMKLEKCIKIGKKND